MFNLDQAISDWRARMLAAGVNALDILDELETQPSHSTAHILSMSNKLGVYESSVACLVCVMVFHSLN